MKKTLIFLLVTLIFSCMSPFQSNAKSKKYNFLKDSSKVYTYIERGRGYVSYYNYSKYSSKNSNYWVEKNQTVGEGEIQTKNNYEFIFERGYGGEYNISRSPKKGYKKVFINPETSKKTLIYTVISTNATIKTKYKTFKHVVVIKHSKEFGSKKVYYASHYGIVKEVDKKGNTIRELAKVK